jgi:hypothetical protein
MNGSGLINQRWAATGSFLASGVNNVYVDRWITGTSTNTVNKITGGRNYANTGFPDGFTSCMGYKTTTAYTPTAGGDVMTIDQYSEGRRLRGLNWGSSNAKPLTISFWLFTNVAGTYSVALRKFYYSVAWSYIHDVTHSGTGWQYFSFTVPANTSSPSSADWDYDGTSCQLLLGFNLGTGTVYRTSTLDTWQNANYTSSTTSTQVVATLNHAFCLTGIQMEIGGTATEYEHISYTQELENCQAYFQKSYNSDTSVGTNTNLGANVFRPVAALDSFTVPFIKSFLKTPTISIIPSGGGFGNIGKFGNGTANVSGATYNQSNNSFVFNSLSNAVVGAYNEFQWWAEIEPNIL